MKTSGIGGQAVIEGIMMRNKDKYAIAVRKPDKEIELTVRQSKLITEKYKWLNVPIIRGIVSFVDSLVTGISTINYSASFYEEPAEQKKTKVDEIGKSIFKDKLEAVFMAITVIISVLIAVALFMLLPYYASRLLSSFIVSQFLLNFIEGVIRVLIFLLYILAVSQIKDIKRTFMYHGAEHKCINCIEHGARLTVENVKNSSRLHKRCGTSFLFLVMFVSVIFFIFIRVDNTVAQIIIRLLLIPVVAGVSYEILKWAGKNDNAFVNIVSKPGMWLQKLTTKEPDEDMIEVAISAVEAVFDWKAFLDEYYEDADDKEAAMALSEAELAISSNLIDNKKKTRSIEVNAAEDVSKRNADETDMEEYTQERFNARFEEQDGSGDTYYDKFYDDEQSSSNEYDELDGFDIEDDETADLKFEAEKVNYLLDDSDRLYAFYENNEAAALDNTVSEEIADEEKLSAKQTDDEYINAETEDDMEGFEFMEDNIEAETYADDVPVFKEREKEGRKN